MFKYASLPMGAYLADDAALRETADALEIAEKSGDPLTLAAALMARGVTLFKRRGPERDEGYRLLSKLQEMAPAEQFSQIVDIHTAILKFETADVDGAIELARAITGNLYASGEMYWRQLAIRTLVEALLRRGGPDDIIEAQAQIDRLAAVPTDPGFVMHALPLLRMRALLAQAHGDEDGYRQFADRYLKMATDLDLPGHIALAEAMT